MAREARQESRSETREPEGRQKRIPLGAPVARLHADHREGFVRRWVNDTPGRIEQAKRAGYAHVEVSGESRKELVGATEQGQPLHAYLMEQQEGYYAEDQAVKEEQNAMVDEAINRGQLSPSVKPNAQDAGRIYGQGNVSRS